MMRRAALCAALGLVSVSAFAAVPTGYGLDFTDMGQWVTFSALLNDSGQPITSFRSSWIVPPIPSASDAAPVYFWNGLEPIDHSVVLQPVLGWYGSGDWMASCYSVGDEENESNEVAVKPGDVLTGVITLVSNSNGTFSYQCEFDGMPDTQLSFSGPELVLAAEVLEQYDVTQCSDYPSGEKFTGIQLETGGAAANLSWHTFNNPNMLNCGQSTSIVDGSLSSGEVDIAVPAQARGL